MPGREASLIGIYRRRNAPAVRALVEAVRAEGWVTAWWALDEPEPSLAEQTVGAGAGPKLMLLNELVRRLDGDPGWLVVADDDVVFTRGGPVELVELCERGQLDLAQPARSDDNSRFEFNVAHPITRARRLSTVRLTTFVEVGPLFVVGPTRRDRFLPFPEQRGMGWGVELDWYERWRGGCRLGIVDAVQVAHTGEPGADYDFASEADRVHRELAERGFDGWKDVQRTLACWRPWRRRPPWIPGGAAG
ncbi:MAG TPA: hypothetical protein VNJ46_07005 [Gaiellaceae bacterium]|nr:hypothetical protein [Gaiellaceae bacterium]